MCRVSPSQCEDVGVDVGVPEAGFDAKRSDRIAMDASRSLNPHAVTGMNLSGTRVYQFRHSGTSAKMAKLRKRTLSSFSSLPRRYASDS